MSITIEDGSIILDANSYASEVDLKEYAQKLGKPLNGCVDVLLLSAMQYVENLHFVGNKYTKDQPLQWPRSGVSIDGFAADVDEIPQQLINLQLSVALSIDGGVDPLAVQERVTSSETVDSISVSYEAGQATTATSPTIAAYENGLVRGGRGVSVRLSRA